MFKLEIFKLDQHLGVSISYSSYEFIHKFVVFFTLQSRCSHSMIIRVLDQFLIISSHIEGNRQHIPRVEPTTRHIKIQLAYTNLDASHPLVTETQNSTAIGDYNGFYIFLWPVVHHRCHFYL